MTTTTITTTSADGAAEMKDFLEHHRFLLAYLSLASIGFLVMALKGVQ